jgi:hypothetical protein
MVEREIKKIDELMQPIIEGFKNLERAVKTASFIIEKTSENLKILQKYYDFGEVVILNQRLKLSLIIERCAANVLESDYVYEFERDFWFKDLNRYERRNLINKVFGVGFFDNFSLSLKIRVLKY